MGALWVGDVALIKTNKMKERLELLAKWMQDYDVYYDERDGALESACKQMKQQVMCEIGEYIEEILEMPIENIANELK